jgi:hypothetical protein
VHGNRDVVYGYGKNGELIQVQDAAQRLSVSYRYDAAGREALRIYGNRSARVSVTIFDRRKYRYKGMDRMDRSEVTDLMAMVKA